MVAVAAVLAITACDDQAPVAPAEPRAPSAALTSIASDSIAFNQLARGLALALADTTLRQQVLEDLRDSPFPDHAVHVASYLAGTRGRPLLDAAARFTGQPRSDLLALVARTRDLGFVLPAKFDRVRWEGTADLVVVATPRSVAEVLEQGAVLGFTMLGDSLIVRPNRKMEKPVLAILRVGASFGADPEDSRRRAPRREAQRTVSTIEEVYGDATSGVAASRSLSPGAIVSSDGFSEGVTTPSQFVNSSCRSGSDLDGDGLNDQCEYELAHAFRPQLKISSQDQDPRREPYFAVYPTKQSTVEPDQVQIFYALSYHYDRGSPVFNAEPHQGDSEFIVVRVRPSTTLGRWVVNSAFLSAHLGTWTDSSEDLGASELQYSVSVRGRPTVWVSEDKHANYRSQSKCDGGAYGTDNCDRNHTYLGDPAYEVEVLSTANLGNVQLYKNGFNFFGNTLQDCVLSRAPGLNFNTECFWTGDRFRGWRDNEDGFYDGTSAGAYSDDLYTFLYR